MHRNDDDLRWLIAREIPHLRRYAALLTGAPDRVDDLVQDCLERALRKRRLWSRQGSLRSWLFRLLYRLHIDTGRSRSRRREITEAAGAEQPRVQPPRQEHSVEVRDLAAAMDDLPEEQRAAIVLVGVEGLSYEETAHILDIPVGTLRSRLSRGRDALRETWTPAHAAATPRLRRVK